MVTKLKLAAYALVLLALAHPALAPPVLGALGVLFGALLTVAGWGLANPSLILTIAAGLTLTRVFPGIPPWLGRALVASVAVVFPRTA